MKSKRKDLPIWFSVSLLVIGICFYGWNGNKTVETSRKANADTSQVSSLRDLSKRLATAEKSERIGLISEGVKLARQRKMELISVAKTDPERALRNMMPLDVLVSLPPEIRAESEVPLNAIGSIDLRWETSINPDGSLKCLPTNIAYVGDRSLTILGIYFQSPQQPMTDVPLNGYILGDVLILDQNPIHRLTAEETETARNTFPEGNADEIDPVTGNPANPLVAALIGGKVYTFENPGILDSVAEILDSAIDTAQTSKTSNSVAHGYTWLAADSGAGNSGTIVQATPFQNDTINVLFVRVDFADLPGAPITQLKLETDLAIVKTRIEQYSHGNASVNYTVTPTVYRLPTNASVVAKKPNTSGNPSNDGNAVIMSETRAAAAVNYNLSNYDVVAAYFPKLTSQPNSLITYGGLASIGGGDHWVNGVSDSGRVFIITHEFGHNYGLYHANYFDPFREIANINEYLNPEQTSLEYGDIFDTMGEGSSEKGYFSPYAMSRMGWFAPQSLVEPTGSGTWRIYRYDTPLPDPTQIRALRISMGGNRYNWVGLRDLYASTARSAYIVNEGIYTNRPNLIDATPGSQSPENADRNDAALPVGSTFTDSNAGVNVTTTASGGTAPALWIDVKVDFEARLGLTKSAISINESDGQVALEVSRSFDSTKTCSVNYATSGQTATSGTDFHPASGTLTWAAGDSSPRTILIPIRPDTISDNGETLTLTLSSPTNAVLPTITSVATVTILDAGSEITSFNPGFINNEVKAVVPLPDGKVIAGGTMSTPTGSIFRLNSDGSEDTTFLKTSGFNSSVRAIVRQTDGKLLVGGDFTSYNASPCNRIARLNADGSFDSAFTTSSGTAASSSVYAIAIEASGKILIGGNFTSFADSAAPGTVRLLATGARDTTTPFTPVFDNQVTPRIQAILVNPDNTVMVGGRFIYPFASGIGFRSCIALLNSNGSRITSFEPGHGTHETGTTGNIRDVNAIVRQADGKIIVGGRFSSYNNSPVPYIVRLNANGTRDVAFIPPAFGSSSGNSGTDVDSLFIQPTGNILVGGRFATPGGRIVRLLPSGQTDATFNLSGGADPANEADTAFISSIVSDSSENLFLGGFFFNFAGSTSRPIVKVSGGVDAYTIWTNTVFTSAQIAAGNTDPEQDFDNDGILNITEMALGLSPTVPNSPNSFAIAAGNLSVQASGGSQLLQASMQRSANNLGVWLVAQFSSDLTTWLPANPFPGSNATYDVTESTSTRFTVKDKTPGSGVKRFVRFRAVVPN